MTVTEIHLPRSTWCIERATEKLAVRDGLPGAHGWDRAADSFRRAHAKGMKLDELLPAALPTSWMVNARATSRVFHRWLLPPLRDAWRTLLDVVPGGPDSWLARSGLMRDEVEAAVTALSIDGQGPCAISKVLALLAPETVPLMDDAAIAFLTGAVPEPATADAPSAPASLFLPTLDAFAQAVLEGEPALIEIAKAHAAVPLDASQVLDRLLWFDSWGHRIVKLP